MLEATIEFKYDTDEAHYTVYLDVTYPSKTRETWIGREWAHDCYPFIGKYTAFIEDRDGGEHERAIDIPEEVLYNEAQKWADQEGL